jgi:hypothetical protein
MSEGTAEMTYQESLARLLTEAFAQVSTVSDGFVLRGRETSVRVVAAEDDIESRARILVSDGLVALGAIRGDQTGLTAGLGLLAVHIEELVGSNPAITRIEVTPTDLRSYVEP